MISFFPSPYPDELWYSVICRYHVHSGNYCAKHTLRQLYGDNFCAPSLMLCGPIKALLAQLPQGFLSARDVVMQHTFYPYYARFFPTQRKRSTYAYVVNGNPLSFQHRPCSTEQNIICMHNLLCAAWCIVCIDSLRLRNLMRISIDRCQIYILILPVSFFPLYRTNFSYTLPYRCISNAIRAIFIY